MNILYDNLISTATVTTSSENPLYLFSDALSDKRLSRKARTLDDNDQWVKMTFTGAVYVDYIAILGHNLTSGATVRIEANTTDSWATPAFSQVLTVTDIVIAKFTTTQNYQYWRIFIDDDSNTDGYIELSKIFLCEYLDMPGMNLDQSVFRKSTAKYEKSNSGQIYGTKRIKYKVGKVSFQDVTFAQKTLIDDFFDSVDLVNPFIIIIWESDLTVEPPIYANLTKDVEFSKMSVGGLLYTFSLEFEECF